MEDEVGEDTDLGERKSFLMNYSKPTMEENLFPWLVSKRNTCTPSSESSLTWRYQSETLSLRVRSLHRPVVIKAKHLHSEVGVFTDL